LTLAYLLALAAQIIILSFWLPKEKYRFQLSVRFDTPEIKSSLNLMIPVLIGGAVAELDAWADVTIASYLGEGNAAVVGFAARLLAFVGLLIHPLSNLVYSYMSDYAAKNDIKTMLEILWKTFRVVLFIVIPIIAIAAPTGMDIVQIVYQRGEFTPDAAALTASVFVWYLPSLIGLALTFIVRFSHALQDMKTPMVCGIVSLAANIGLSYLFSLFMGVAGIACGTSIATIFGALLLLVAIRRKIGPMGFGETAIDIMKLLLCAAPCLLAVLGVSHLLEGQWALLRFAVCTLVGGVAYLLPAYLLKELALRDLLARMKGLVGGR
jgi:putative peptidoglycan lipid II flippase